MREIDASAARFLRVLPGRRKAELHLHLEGAVSARTLVDLSLRDGTGVFPSLAAVAARIPPGSPGQFLELYRDVCRHLRGPADYARVARDLVRRLSRERVTRAEVYVSPAILERMGLDYGEIVPALDGVFARFEARTGSRVRILLDSVRQWGPEAAGRVLDAHERVRWRRVVGFGLGGDEASLPARDFAGIYRRVRRLGLAPLVHAGEWAGPGSVAEALRWLQPVRIAHGFRAAEDPALLRELARRGTFLDLCLASNVATGALPALSAHPARALLAAGVRGTLSTDDPGLFRTTLFGEYRALARLGASGEDLRKVLRNGFDGALAG